MLTYSYRIKDSGASGHALEAAARSVNMIWNFCNETQKTALGRASARLVERSGQKVAIPNFLAAFEFHPLLKSCGKELGLHSQTVQAIAEEFVTRRKQFKKRWLRWRSNKKSLGWIPFKASGLTMIGDTVKYCGHEFRLWLSREVEGTIKTGSFSQDSRGRWYVNITTDHVASSVRAETKEVGIDLGLKTLATASDGRKFGSARYFRRYARALGLAQKDGKGRRAKAINAKIKNSRQDLSHKISHELTRDNNLVVIGNVSSSKLVKTSMAKSVLDAGWSQLRTFLKYKAIARECVYIEVSEYLTSQTCSCCETRSPVGAPRGVKGLGIREWVCGSCNAVHDRDVNAALNILRIGRDSLGLK